MLLLLVNVLVCTAAWVAVFQLIKWKWSLTFDSASYATAFVHGFLITRFCEYSIFTEQLLSIEKIGGPSTPLQNCIITLSAGYFYYDFVVCFVMKQPLYMKAHHLFAIMIFTITLLAEYSGPEVIICLWCGEFTNVCLNLRYFFQNNKHLGYSKVPMLNDAAFAVSFMVLRFVILTYVIFHILTSGKSLLIVKIGSIGFTVVNFIMGKMVVSETMGFLFPPPPCVKKEN